MAQRPSTIEKRRQRRVEKARKGGLALKAKYGRDHFVQIGKLGGRPTFWEDLAKRKARTAAIREGIVGPGRPRNAVPLGRDEGVASRDRGLPGTASIPQKVPRRPTTEEGYGLLKSRGRCS